MSTIVIVTEGYSTSYEVSFLKSGARPKQIFFNTAMVNKAVEWFYDYYVVYERQASLLTKGYEHTVSILIT